MKQALQLLRFFCLSLIVATALIGCSKNPGAKVNLQAQIADLKSPDKDKRADACVALGIAGERAAPAVPDLIDLLKDKDEEVRRLAAYALQQIGPKAKAAVPALQELLTTDPSMKVQMQVGNSLRDIDPSNAPPATPNVQF
ncbi:MAG: HEAT repeat domain-containing protein [Limisphaerales bacterium]